MTNKSYEHFSWFFSFFVFVIGIFSTVTVVSGDSSGRVNLLYLILLYVLFPIVSLISLLFFSVFKSQSSAASAFFLAPIWPRQWQAALLELKREKLFKFWLLNQTQKLMLAFTLGCSLSFIIVLLFNDLYFVWRSTLLSAEHIFPILNAIALPWFFVDSAQPVLELLIDTQDSRLTHDVNQATNYGAWWQFILAAQLFYGILPRSLLFATSYYRFKNQLKNITNHGETLLSPLINQSPAVPQLSPIVSTTELTQYCLVIWADFPKALEQLILNQYGTPMNTCHVGPHGEMSEELAAEQDTSMKLVIVASWEPPMGELQDFLQLGHGYLMPLDWQQQRFNPITDLHLDEWRRFCHQLKDWTLLQPKDLL